MRRLNRVTGIFATSVSDRDMDKGSEASHRCRLPFECLQVGRHWTVAVSIVDERLAGAVDVIRAHS